MSQNWILSENKDYLGKAQKMENRITGKKLDELRAFFAQDRFATENGAYVEEAGENYAKCSMELTDRHKNARGAVMGGVHFVLADFNFAVGTVRSIVKLQYHLYRQGQRR